MSQVSNANAGEDTSAGGSNEFAAFSVLCSTFFFI